MQAHCPVITSVLIRLRTTSGWAFGAIYRVPGSISGRVCYKILGL